MNAIQSQGNMRQFQKCMYPFPLLESMGFCPTGIEAYLPPGSDGRPIFLEDFLSRIDQYQVGRDFPAIKGVSYLSTHLRFGMLSIRGLVREAHRRMLAGSMGATVWLSELIWRDFYFMILANHPRLAGGGVIQTGLRQHCLGKWCSRQKIVSSLV
jgi:deoxyribodipyrimidine photo-lyase